MKRVLKWAAVIAAAFLCAMCGLYLHRVFIDYNDMQNDINRQLSEIDRLRQEAGRYASSRAHTQSVSETVAFMSSQITCLNLAEQSLRSEKCCMELNGWEEWRIEAVCTGTADEITAFIHSLEAAGTYHDMSFTVEIFSDGVYELNIEICFYARYV